MVASASQCENSDQGITDAKEATSELRRSSSVNPRKEDRCGFGEIRKKPGKISNCVQVPAFSTAPIPREKKK